jgi:uncharacterized protein
MYTSMPKKEKYGLPESTLEDVTSILKKNYKISKLILFGSRAKGSFNNGSDVDIALQGSELALNDILDASLEIENLFLPYKFDLIIYDRIIEESLISHINRVGIVLYQRDTV